MNQKGLHEKYGVEYSGIPNDGDGLKKAIEECRTLTAAAAGDSLFYVEMPGTVRVASELLSDDLLAVLKKAGWTGNRQFQADGAIYFLEDNDYHSYIKSVFLESSCPQKGAFNLTAGGTETEGRKSPVVLVNRYVNRTVFSENGQTGRMETALLSENAQKMLNEGAVHPSDLQIECNIFMDEADMLADDFSDGQELRADIVPDACTDTLPDGIDAGKAAVILPLSRMQDFCLNVKNISFNMGKGMEISVQNMHVCGLFADRDEEFFERL